MTEKHAVCFNKDNFIQQHLCFRFPLVYKTDHAPQQFIAWPASSDLEMRCAADGEPPLKYQWLKDGKVLTHRRLDPKYVLYIQGFIAFRN